MGKTVIEKIFAAHSGDDIVPGNVIWLDIDVRSARDFGGANVVAHLRREYAHEKKLDNPEKTFFTFDCVSPANTIPYAENQQIIRTFAIEQGARLYDVGHGIGTHILIENGHIRPGMTAVGTDSHFNILGAVGAFGQGMGDRDIAFAFKTGKVWFEVPSSVRVNLSGMPAHSEVGAKDIALELLRRFGASSLLGRVVELYGEWVESATLDERITVASMGTEMGLISIIIPPNGALLDELRQWVPVGEVGTSSIKLDDPIYRADPDCNYESEITIDISALEPLIAAPFEPHNVHPRADFAGKKVDSVFVGSCTGGRISDLRALAEKIETGIAPNLILRVVPATKRTLELAVDEGVYRKLFDSGAVVSHAACGGCASGQIGMTGSGEVQVSTGNRNFKGKQGAGETFLASALTAGEVASKGTL